MSGLLPAARLDAVSHSYHSHAGDVQVLRGASAAFAAGEFAVLLGRSGSGKTTVLNLLGGLDLPDSGDVWLQGTCISRLDEAARARLRRDSLGIVHQNYNLVPTLTAEENVALPLELAGHPLGEALCSAGKALQRLGLDGRLRHYPDELSGGEQQRVAIARAVVRRPSVLVADEPTGSLDVETAREVIALLVGVCREDRATLVVATHSSEIAERADSIWRIQAGRLVLAGAPGQ